MHGGANEAAINMLMEIGHIDNIPKYLEKAKDKSDPFKLMGFGHRVYKNHDPRATAMMKVTKEVLAEKGLENDPEFALAMELERLALEDEYFVKRKVYSSKPSLSSLHCKF